MVNSSFHLFQLQKIDLRIDAIQKRLTEIEKFRKNNTARKLIEESLASINLSISKNNDSLLAVEEKIRTKKLKIEQSESSLYGGSIKNPKELQDLQAEIKSLKLALSSYEDDQLQIMIDREALDKELAVIETNLSEFDQKMNIQYSSLLAEENDKKVENNKISQERKAMLDQISEQNLKLYQSLRTSKNGIAVSTIEDGCCASCGSTLTPADCQAAKSPAQMATCGSCGRILYGG